MREIILVIFIVIAVIAYFKAAYSIVDKKLNGILWVAVMLLVFGFSVMLNFLLIRKQDRLEEELKEARKGLPEYVEAKGVYVIKKK